MRFLLTTPPAPAPPPMAMADVVDGDVVVGLLIATIFLLGVSVALGEWVRAREKGRPRVQSLSLRERMIQSLPKFVYGHLGLDCSICLRGYVQGNEVRVLPQCGHAFHLQCIDTWLMSDSSCPSCRLILTADRCRTCRRRWGVPGAGDHTRT